MRISTVNRTTHEHSFKPGEKMSWIRMAIAGVAFLGAASVGAAQAPQGAPPAHGDHAGPQKSGRGGGSKMLFNGIELTEAQKAQVEQISEKYRAQHEALRSASGQTQGPPDEAARAKRQELMNASHAEYRAILNADQQNIFDQNVAEMKARKEQRKKPAPSGSRA